MTAPASGTIVTHASAPFGVVASFLIELRVAPASGTIVTHASAPFGVRGTVGFTQNIDIDPETGQIIVVAWVPFGIGLSFNRAGFIGQDQLGGWLPDREHATAKRRAKIKAKRERRQDFVMRKIFAELRGLEPDERLLALMAEFETVEDLIKSNAQIQAEFRKAYFDFIILVQQRQAEQDKEDEAAIMFALSELL